MWQLLRICLPVKIADRRMPMKKEKKIFVPYLKCFLFEQDSWKNNIFYKKQVESEHVLKYFENLGY